LPAVAAAAAAAAQPKPAAASRVPERVYVRAAAPERPGRVLRARRPVLGHGRTNLGE